jgi:sarcosine/dimethylglycine N-methyltransferase
MLLVSTSCETQTETYAETDLVATIERLAGREIGALTQSQLDGIDQFHVGGPDAIDLLLPSLGLGPRMTALDVGSGLGGPARQVARATGCTVVGVDLTASYVEAATALTRAAGQEGSVTFHRADLTDPEDASALEQGEFDAAYTMHVQTNVSDKRAFFGAIAARLSPGGRLATFEICRTGAADPEFPVPWSIDGTDSFLPTSAELLATIEESGFATVEWVDETPWTLEWFQGLGPRLAASNTPATLPALLTDGPTRMMNFAAALSNGVLSVHRGAFRRL